nr:probable magnesium transporter NIPA4 [Ipomoea batatas]GMD75812.1 probable magnesium transporter NIPA4 [Ipomoea batatas]
MSADNIKGLVLAISSSFFIGSSFIVKKKGLKKAGSGSGLRAGLSPRGWDAAKNTNMRVTHPWFLIG